MFRSLTKGTDEHLKFIEANKKEINGMLYCGLLDKFEKNEIEMAVPCIDEEPLKISNVVEWQNIKIMKRELFELPWIFYYCEYEGDRIVISYTYPELAGSDKTDFEYEDIAAAFNEDFPTSKNVNMYAKSYSDIVKKELNLKDSTVTATIYYLKNNDRVHYRFVKNNVLYSIWKYEGGEINDNFWKAFSIKNGNDLF